MNTKSYDCRRKPDGAPDSELKEIGDYTWRVIGGQPQGIQIVLPNPNENGELSWIPVEGASHTCGPCWTWDGNLDRPTFAPSLLNSGRWHGHLQNGRLVSC